MRLSFSPSNQEPNPSDSEEQLRRLLEDQLSQVVSPSTEKRRTRRKIRRFSGTVPVSEEVSTAVEPSILNTVKKTKKTGPVRIQIHHRRHVESPFVLPIQGLVQPIQEETRSPREKSIHEWLLPADAVVSSDALLSEAIDLHVVDVDPFVFHQQFTPKDPTIAYSEAYGFLQRLRAPFIRWEVVRAGQRSQKDQATRQAERRSKPLAEALPSDFELQWTDQTASERTSLALKLAVLRARFSGALSWTKEHTEKVIDEAKEEERSIMVEVEEAWGIPVMVPRIDFVKIFGGLAALLLVVSLPAGAVSLSRSFRGSVQQSLANGQTALQEVTDVTSGSDPLTAAPSALALASERFRQAEDGLRQANGLATLIVRSLPQTRDAYKTSVALLSVGTQATKAGRLISEGVHEALTAPARYPVERLVTLQNYLNAAAPALHQANEQFAQVNAALLPMDQQAKVAQARLAVGEGAQAVDDISDALRFARVLLGESREQTYLLVFQNQSELRPTGGFMGSVAELMISKGEVTHTFVPGGGPYDLRGQMKTRVLPPEPLRLVNAQWEFQDANWFPDFSAAAQKISWFWSQGGQSTLDGVVSVNASMLEPLLRFTGPIELPAYGKTFTADNIQLELQKSVELEYDKTENKPKKIIGDLFPIILEKLRNATPEDNLRLISLLSESLQKKEIQLWFRDQDLQSYVERYGWAGRIKPTQGDALGIFEANIGGQKTDAVIREQVNQQVHILPDGHIEVDLTLDRTHDGSWGELFRGANNVAYVRTYVPKGSQLLSVEGLNPPTSTSYKQISLQDPIDQDVATLVGPSTKVLDVDVTHEFDRTAFGAWVQLKPGQQSHTTFRYRLPFTVQDISKRAEATQDSTGQAANQTSARAYTLYVTSQSGKTDRRLNLSIDYPASWSVRWQNRTDLVTAPGTAAWSGDLSQDQVFALSFASASAYDASAK